MILQRNIRWFVHRQTLQEWLIATTLIQRKFREFQARVRVRHEPCIVCLVLLRFFLLLCHVVVLLTHVRRSCGSGIISSRLRSWSIGSAVTSAVSSCPRSLCDSMSPGNFYGLPWLKPIAESTLASLQLSSASVVIQFGSTRVTPCDESCRDHAAETSCCGVGGD